MIARSESCKQALTGNGNNLHNLHFAHLDWLTGDQRTSGSTGVHLRLWRPDLSMEERFETVTRRHSSGLSFRWFYLSMCEVEGSRSPHGVIN